MSLLSYGFSRKKRGAEDVPGGDTQDDTINKQAKTASNDGENAETSTSAVVQDNGKHNIDFYLLGCTYHLGLIKTNCGKTLTKHVGV